MKKSNRISAGIMALCLAGSVCVIPESIAPTVSITASAVDTYEGLTYKIGNDDTVTITGYDDKTLTDIVIPDTIEGLPVTAIGDAAFYDSSKITSIKLPSTLKKIGNSAFKYCNSITSMDIPDGVTSIGNGVFDKCKSLETITLPNSLTTIGYNAFNSCEKITELSIPYGVTSIGESAFSYCKSLERITIPDSVTSIGESAFYYCTSLEHIAIPDSVTLIELHTFEGCKSLERIVIPANVKGIFSYAFNHCENMKELVILNPKATIYNLGIPSTANYIIYGYEGSTAETYAQKVDVRFKNVSEYSGTPITTTTTTTTTTTSTTTTTTTTAKSSATTTTTTTDSTNADSPCKGDANGDGKLSLADAVFIMQAISNPTEYQIDEKLKDFADVVDKGNGLSPIDALAIQMVDLKIISESDLPITSEKLNSILDQQ